MNVLARISKNQFFEVDMMIAGSQFLVVLPIPIKRGQGEDTQLLEDINAGRNQAVE